MIVLGFSIDCQDAVAEPANTWFFINSVDSGNNQNITFTTWANVYVSNVDVRDCNASPAFWFADGNSVDSGNNVNWIFGPTPPVIQNNSEFFLFLE